MHFDERNTDSHKGVTHCNASVRKRCRIDDDELGPITPGAVNTFDQFELGIVLETHHAIARIIGKLVQYLVDIFERGIAVVRWFTRAQQVEVRSVKYQYFGHSGLVDEEWTVKECGAIKRTLTMQIHPKPIVTPS
jgi:hypothetical protein